MAEHWIQGAIKHPGALHRELHVPEGEKIPKGKIAKAAHSSNPTLAKRARLAETLSRMGHGAKEVHIHQHVHHHEASHKHKHTAQHDHYETEERGAEEKEHPIKRTEPMLHRGMK